MGHQAGRFWMGFGVVVPMSRKSGETWGTLPTVFPHSSDTLLVPLWDTGQFCF
jgi:hypothetical protein